jgi:hypothetical protein
MDPIIKIWLFILLTFTLISCEDELKSNLVLKDQSISLEEINNYKGLKILVDSLSCIARLDFIIENDATSFSLPLLNNCTIGGPSHVQCLRLTTVPRDPEIEVLLSSNDQDRRMKMSEYVLNPDGIFYWPDSPNKACLQLDLPLDMSIEEVNKALFEFARLFSEITRVGNMKHDLPIHMSLYRSPPPPPPKIIK